MSIPQCTLTTGSVTFHSNSKKYYEFSNFYECKVPFHDLVFPSAEHAYQCLQKVEGSYEDWCVGGKFADWEYVLGIMNEHKPIRKEYWNKKKMIGILAKLVITHPKTFGIKLKQVDEDLAVSVDRWFPILNAKFQGDLKDMLLKTSGTLVEQDRMAMLRLGKWGGLVKDGVLYGPNIMGHLLTKFRDSIRPKRPIAEVEEVAHMSTLDVVEAKFKKARTEGKVVDLTDTSEPILNVENAVVTFAGSIESDTSGRTHGRKRRGFTANDLVNIAHQFPGKATIYNIPGGPHAFVLVLRNLDLDHRSCFQEITSVPDAYVDHHTWMYGQCREKKSRVNTNYADIDQMGAMDHPDPSKRVPSLLKFGTQLKAYRDFLTDLGTRIGVDTKNLYGEVNYYLKSKTLQGIGEHMDKERNMVIGLCLGTMWRNIAFQAYEGAIPIGPKLMLRLNPGDMYFMDVNAKGTGSVTKPHVRHHASGGTGGVKYMKRVTQARARKLKGKEGLNKYAQAIVDGNEMFTDGYPTYL